MMNFARWLLTFLGFPFGGFLAVLTVGSVTGPAAAAAGGTLAGAVVGLAQWLVLRRRGVSARWAAHTAVAMGAGGALSAALTGAGTGVQALMLSGLITGTLVGGAQGLLLRRGAMPALVWTGAVGLAWSLGWLTTWSAGIDVERGYVVFGASGALVVTALTGVALRRLLGDGHGAAALIPAGPVPHVVGA